MATTLEPMFHRDFAAHRFTSKYYNVPVGIANTVKYREIGYPIINIYELFTHTLT